MELQLSNQLQHHIADLLWEAKDGNEVTEILFTYGKDAMVVYEMMIAAHFDNIMETDLAMELLSKF